MASPPTSGAGRPSRSPRRWLPVPLAAVIVLFGGGAADAAAPALPAAFGAVDAAAGAPGEGPQPTPANAWRVSPASAPSGESRTYFVLDAVPGETVRDVLVVENSGAEARTLDVYGQEARLTPDGKYSAPPGHAADGSFGTWITPQTGTVTVEPYGRAEVPFTVEVPVAATPGDYDGAVFTSLAQPAAGDGGQVVVDLRVGVRLHLRVAGDLAPGLAVTDLRPERLAPWWNPFPAEVGLSFTVTNTGNTRISGKAVADAVAAYPWATDRQSGLDAVDTPELLPGSSVQFTSRAPENGEAWARGPHFTGIWGIGRQTYTARVVDMAVPFSDVELSGVDATVAVLVVPWAPLIVLAGLLVAAGLLVRRSLRRRKARRRLGGTPAPAAAPLAAAGTDR